MKFRGKTVKVILENDWFTPYGFIAKDPNGFPVNIDERLVAILPKSARLVDETYEPSEDRVVIPTPQSMGTLARDLYDEELERIKTVALADTAPVLVKKASKE